MTDTTAPTTPGPISRAVASSDAAAVSIASTVVSAPGFWTLLNLMAGGLITLGGMAVKAHYYDAPPAPAIVGKATPIEATAAVDAVVKANCDGLGTKLDDVLSRLPAPAKRRLPVAQP
jgi:hypothetical protein